MYCSKEEIFSFTGFKGHFYGCVTLIISFYIVGIDSDMRNNIIIICNTIRQLHLLQVLPIMFDVRFSMILVLIAAFVIVKSNKKHKYLN